jgi:hypothetical protein
MYRQLAIGVATLILAGCASGGPSGKDVLTASVAPQKARIVLYRTTVLGFAVQPQYLVNGMPVAPAQPSGFFVCDLAPGTHSIAADNPSFNVNFGGGSDKVQVGINPGETKFVRADIQMGLTVGVVTLTEVTAATGRAETQTLSQQAGGCPEAAAQGRPSVSAAAPAPSGSAAPTRVADTSRPARSQPGRGGDCPGYMHRGQKCTDAASRTCTQDIGRRICD